MNNLAIYEGVRHVPDEAKTSFNNGRFSGTDINPMWRIKKLTELFGPCGVGWYYEVLSERSERLTDDTMIAVVDLNLYIKTDGEWSKPIYGTGGNQLISKTKSGISTSDEGYKMALTDALSVACKALGIGADVYFSNDKTKYTAQPEATRQPQKQLPVRQTPPPPEEMPPLPFDDTPPPPPVKPVREMATVDQIEYIVQNVDDQTYENAMTAFGPNLERMSRKQADALIRRIKEGMPGANV